METYTIISSIGIALDMIGVIIIFFFGIATKLDTEGHPIITFQNIDKKEISETKKYKRLSWLGLFIIFIGFSLQLVSNFIK